MSSTLNTQTPSTYSAAPSTSSRPAAAPAETPSTASPPPHFSARGSSE